MKALPNEAPVFEFVAPGLAHYSFKQGDLVEFVGYPDGYYNVILARHALRDVEHPAVGLDGVTHSHVPIRDLRPLTPAAQAVLLNLP